MISLLSQDNLLHLILDTARKGKKPEAHIVTSKANWPQDEFHIHLLDVEGRELWMDTIDSAMFTHWREMPVYLLRQSLISRWPEVFAPVEALVEPWMKHIEEAIKLLDVAEEHHKQAHIALEKAHALLSSTVNSLRS